MPSPHIANPLAAPDLFGYRKYWAHRLTPAPFLPMSREEMDVLGWDQCDVILVTGDAYVDHPSFGMAIVGRVLEAQGFRVGIIAQPELALDRGLRAPRRARAVLRHHGRQHGFDGQPLHGRSSACAATTPTRPMAAAGCGPTAASSSMRSACARRSRTRPIVIGGIEASLRRIAHYDYWQEKVRRSILLDARADLLVFGNGERQIVEIAHRLAGRRAPSGHREHPRHRVPRQRGRRRLDGDRLDASRLARARSTGTPIPYAMEPEIAAARAKQRRRSPACTSCGSRAACRPRIATRSYIRLPSFEQVRDDSVLYAHASRILHMESNPGNARALVQRHGASDVWLNPPPLPLTSEEMDRIYELPYARVPHPTYGDAKIPAYEMIRFSVTIQRGCFGGCTFCSITEHEGRIIQNRSEDSILREIETIRDNVPGFTGVISDLGGPTANMYRLACKSREIESACRRPSCVYPGRVPEPEHRSRAADQALSEGARAAGREEGARRIGRALRPRHRERRST